MTALSGAEVLTPGRGGAARSYLLPAFQWTGYGDTNPTGFNQHSGVRTQSTYTGSLTAQRIQKNSQLNLSYAGGAFFYRQPLPAGAPTNLKPYGTFHELELFEQVHTRRWKWLVGDQGMYLPETPLGSQGLGGLTRFGGGFGGAALANAPSLNPSFSPNQSIMTGSARRLSNSALTQIEYDPSGRSAITATASYGTLDFFDPGYIDSRYWIFMAGYSHQLSRRNQLAVTYAHYYFKFSGPNRSFLNRGFSILYGHQITGRLSLEVSIAPLVNEIAQPLGAVATKSFVSTFNSLQYRSRNWDARLSFSRMATGGSGILPGVETDLTQGAIGRQLSQKVRGSLQFSHAYNQSLGQQSTHVRRSKYEYWQAGFGLSREFGSHLSTYLNYYAQRQISNVPLCVGSNCTTTFIRQVGGVGISWHARPIRID